jgi:hypothetical protein
MSELSHPTSINRDYIRLLQVMRRFIKEEFAVTVSISQGDAIEKLLHYAEQSRNDVLQEMAKELQEFAHPESNHAETTESEAQPKGKVRYYRGAVIAIEDDEGEGELAAKDEAPAAKEKAPAPKKIYRGRVVE